MLRDKECGVILLPRRLAHQRRPEEGLRRHDPQQHGRRDRLAPAPTSSTRTSSRPSASATTSPADELKSGLFDGELREHAIDRIYDTLIDEEELRVCDETTQKIFDALEPGRYSSPRVHPRDRRATSTNNGGPKSAPTASSTRPTSSDVPIFCPAFSDCSAGFGLVAHPGQPRPTSRSLAGTAARTSTS